MNARDAMPKGGVLTIETRNVDPASLPAFLRKEDVSGEFVMFTVPDSGTGIPDEYLQETILLVEDQETVRDVARLALERHGFVVHTANSGEDAFELFSEHEHSIDLVLTDVIMPGMDGKDVVRHVHERAPNLPVIHLSGYTQDAIARHDVLDMGTQIIQKPFLPKDLAQKVREALDSSTTGDASTE